MKRLMKLFFPADMTLVSYSRYRSEEELLDSPSSYTTPLSLPYGVALDAVGNLYVADSGSNRILEVAAATVAPLSFPSTVVGNPA